MIRRIVSGGQTGVDRAALDAAIEFGIPCGGWCPLGRRAEDGRIPQAYPLVETATRDYECRTEWNVRDTDATLILNEGRLTGGTAHTRDFAEKYRRPWILAEPDPARDLERVLQWIAAGGIEVLNVAGPRESTCSGIYGRARCFLRRLLSRERRRVP